MFSVSDKLFNNKSVFVEKIKKSEGLVEVYCLDETQILQVVYFYFHV